MEGEKEARECKQHTINTPSGQLRIYLRQQIRTFIQQDDAPSQEEAAEMTRGSRAEGKWAERYPVTDHKVSLQPRINLHLVQQPP